MDPVLLVLVAVLAVVAAIAIVFALTRPKNGEQNARRPRLLTAEMLLVVIMLLLMTALVGTVYLFPPPVSAQDENGYEFRLQIISLLVAAFGAWIGAGAAYFFGRENLRVAAESILAMKEPSARERLRSKTVAELRPRQITWTTKTADKLSSITDKIEGDAGWFIPVVEADGRLNTVLSEDDLWRYSASLQSAAQPKTYAEVLDTTINDLVTFVTSAAGYKPRFVTVTPDRTGADASDQMNRAEARLAVVVDEQAKPIGFLTTGDIRRFLLND